MLLLILMMERKDVGRKQSWTSNVYLGAQEPSCSYPTTDAIFIFTLIACAATGNASIKAFMSSVPISWFTIHRPELPYSWCFVEGRYSASNC